MTSPQDIPVDPTYLDKFSDPEFDIVEESEYSTESLNSSIFDYRFQNGRRYHAHQTGQTYLLPNDEAEQERLDIVHHVYLLLNNDKLHLAPISKNPQKILDIGTGTGIWAIDAAERYPSAHVIGTDLSPIQPSWVPPNLEFQIDDAEAKWTFPKDSFDLIHIRHLAAGVKNWEHVLKEAYDHCKPGGYIEMSEYEMSVGSDDGTCHEKLALWKFYDLVDRAAVMGGARAFRIAKVLQPLMEQAGFTNVIHQEFKIPLGTWPADKKQKEIGAYVMLSAESGFEAFGINLFINVWGMSLEEARALIEECKRNGRDRKIHSYSRHHFYYGQKPFDVKTRA